MRPRNKNTPGTVNTEVPQKNIPAKNTIFPPNSQSGKGAQGWDMEKYYNSSSYLVPSVTNENLIKGDSYSSKTSTNQALSNRGATSSMESGIANQSKIAALKK